MSARSQEWQCLSSHSRRGSIQRKVLALLFRIIDKFFHNVVWRDYFSSRYHGCRECDTLSYIKRYIRIIDQFGTENTVCATILHMFESPKDKPLGDEPIDPSRRKALGTLVGIGIGAISGGVLGADKIKDNQKERSADPSLDYPTRSSGVVQKFESTRPILMEQLVQMLKTKGKEGYILAINFLDGLRKEQATLLKRKVEIVDMLKKIGNSNLEQPFLLLEYDRNNKALIELDTYIKEIGTAMEQSPFHNTPAAVHIEEKPGSDGYIDENKLPTTPKERKRIM